MQQLPALQGQARRHLPGRFHHTDRPAVGSPERHPRADEDNRTSWHWRTRPPRPAPAAGRKLMPLDQKSPRFAAIFGGADHIERAFLVFLELFVVARGRPLISSSRPWRCRTTRPGPCRASSSAHPVLLLCGNQAAAVAQRLVSRKQAESSLAQRITFFSQAAEVHQDQACGGAGLRRRIASLTASRCWRRGFQTPVRRRFWPPVTGRGCRPRAAAAPGGQIFHPPAHVGQPLSARSGHLQ